MHWVGCEDGQTPEDGVMAGFDADGGSVYVGRIFQDDLVRVAKVAPGHGCAYYCQGDIEMSTRYYEVLCGEDYDWVEVEGGQLPPEAFSAGDGGGFSLYFGRANINGETTVGEISSDGGTLTGPQGGQAWTTDTFQVLTSLS